MPIVRAKTGKVCSVTTAIFRGRVRASDGVVPSISRVHQVEVKKMLLEIEMSLSTGP